VRKQILDLHLAINHLTRNTVVDGQWKIFLDTEHRQTARTATSQERLIRNDEVNKSMMQKAERNPTTMTKVKRNVMKMRMVTKIRTSNMGASEATKSVGGVNGVS
jgi:hypothetical protein